MSFATYYLGILARRKAGFPTMDEARRDYRAALAGFIPVRYS